LTTFASSETRAGFRTAAFFFDRGRSRDSAGVAARRATRTAASRMARCMNRLPFDEGSIKRGASGDEGPPGRHPEPFGFAQGRLREGSLALLPTPSAEGRLREGSLSSSKGSFVAALLRMTACWTAL
jgi:hypothetical protein